jgi:hypothetical protein
VAQLGDRQIYNPCAGVELARPYPLHWLLRRYCVGRIPPAQRIGFAPIRGMEKRRYQLPQHIGMGVVVSRSTSTAGQSISWAVVIAWIPLLE